MYELDRYLVKFINQIIEILPDIIGALIILIVGWIIAIFIAAVVRKALIWMNLDSWMAKTGMGNEGIRQANPKLRPSILLSSIAKWLVILGASGMASEILNLEGVSTFIGTLLAFVPNILIAIIIISIGLITAHKVSELIMTATGKSSVPSGNREVMSLIAKYAILVFTTMAALTQLHIVPRLIEIAFAGLVFALALAFGLGGREHASNWIATMKSKSRI